MGMAMDVPQLPKKDISKDPGIELIGIANQYLTASLNKEKQDIAEDLHKRLINKDYYGTNVRWTSITDTYVLPKDFLIGKNTLMQKCRL